MSAHKFHLSYKDRIMLAEAKIACWPCPDCAQKALPPAKKLKVEEVPKEDDEVQD